MLFPDLSGKKLAGLTSDVLAGRAQLPVVDSWDALDGYLANKREQGLLPSLMLGGGVIVLGFRPEDTHRTPIQPSAASSGVRLQKIAQSIATFCKHARRHNSASYNASIADWEDDLAWLKKSFYDGKFDRKFPWPRTQ
jgi:hypothetical protein